MIHWEEMYIFSKDLITSEALFLTTSLKGQYQNLKQEIIRMTDKWNEPLDTVSFF